MTDFKWRHFQGDVILWEVRQEVIQEVTQEVSQEFAQRLLSKGMSREDVAEMANLPLAEIDKLIN